MPRKPLIRAAHYPYHITARSNNQQWYQLPMPRVWSICLKAMKHASIKHPVEVISFVLMSNHYHLLIKTPKENLDHFMYEFNKNISLALRRETSNINRMFGGRYKWCLIKSQRYFANCYRYVYQNPVRAKMAKKCEDYPYSTLYYKKNSKKFVVPIIDSLGLCDEYGLLWLNQHIPGPEALAIKNSLYRCVLTQLKDAKTKKLI